MNPRLAASAAHGEPSRGTGRKPRPSVSLGTSPTLREREEPPSPATGSRRSFQDCSFCSGWPKLLQDLHSSASVDGRFLFEG